jgi:hypothetical protein
MATRMPSFDGATAWLNSPPLTAEALRGRVVLANFCTFTCINWLRQLPYVRAWADRYASDGLVVVGVHTPEFVFEGDVGNVRAALRDRIGYPVAVDSDYAIWSAFANRYWPAIYLADADGVIRHHHFGEGAYDETEVQIRQLLEEAGSAPSADLAMVDAQGVEAPADWDDLATPETYTGYDRADSFASIGGAVMGVRHDYQAPQDLSLNHWALSGAWTREEEAATTEAPDGRIACRFHARDLHLVMGPANGGPLRYRVLLDGRPPGPAHGIDVDDEGYGITSERRLHQLIRQPGEVSDRTFEISFLDPRAEAYAFTFG